MLVKSPKRSTWIAFIFVPWISFAQHALPPGVIPLRVDAGTPLRLYITKRVSYRLNEPVQGKLVEPVWSFDRIVIPAGAMVHGRVAKLDPVPRLLRVKAINSTEKRFRADITNGASRPAWTLA